MLCQRVLEHIACTALRFGGANGRAGKDLDEERREFLRFELADFGVDLFGVYALCCGLIGTHFAIKEPMIMPFGKGLVSLSVEVFANIVFDAIDQAIGILVFDHQGISFSHTRC